MSEAYYLNTRPSTDGRYLIHRHGCPFLPARQNRIFIGAFRSAILALKNRIWLSPHVKPCPYCNSVRKNTEKDRSQVVEKPKMLHTHITEHQSLVDTMFCSAS